MSVARPGTYYPCALWLVGMSQIWLDILIQYNAGLFYAILSSADIFFNINFSKKFFQEYHQKVKWVGSRSGL